MRSPAKADYGEGPMLGRNIPAIVVSSYPVTGQEKPKGSPALV